MGQERRIDRRRIVNWFLGTSLGALALAVLYPVIRFLDPPEVAQASGEQVDAGAVNDAEFREAGYKIVRLGADPVIVIRAADGDFRAFSATCTHLDCIVEYRPQQQVIWCNCHNGQFNLQGQVIGGPPPKPLPQYQVNLVDGEGGQRVVLSRSRA